MLVKSLVPLCHNFFTSNMEIIIIITATIIVPTSSRLLGLNERVKGSVWSGGWEIQVEEDMLTEVAGFQGKVDMHVTVLCPSQIFIC